jgi:hypothetical protein
VDGLLGEREESVICYDRFGFNFKSISEVTGSKKVLDEELLRFLS